MSRAGAVVEGFQLVKPIGEGPFGVVWQARDPRSQRAVAIKLLKPHIVTQSYAKTTFSRLQAAAKAYADLNHKSLAGLVRAVQQPEENAYGVASEFVEGQSLDRLQLTLTAPNGRFIDAKRLTKLLGWFEQIAGVLAWLHAKSVIHGNIKPTNLMLVQGSNANELKLLDLAWSAIGVAVPPQGAPSFLAPEQLAGSPPSPASDQYSLMLMFQRYLAQGGRRLSQEEGVPPRVLALIDRATKQKPEARYRSMVELADAIKEARRILLEEGTDKAMALSHSQPPAPAPTVKLGAVSPKGFGEEPDTVRLPLNEPKPPPKRSNSKANRPVSLSDELEDTDFVAPIALEGPGLEIGDLRLSESQEIMPPPHLQSRRNASKTSPFMVAGAVLFIAAGGVVVFTQTHLGATRDGSAVVEASPKTEPPKTELPKTEPAQPKPTEKPAAEAPANTHGETAPVKDAKTAAASKEEPKEAAVEEVHPRGRHRDGSGKGAKALDDKADQAMARLEALPTAKSDGGDPAASLETACDEGDGQACGKLGDLLRSGKGAQKSDAKARSAFERGCNFGRGEACHKAAEMWSEGQGGAQDKSRARALEDSACKHGRKASCSGSRTSTRS